MRDVRLVWALFAADAVAILVTYWRLPPEETYHVAERGLGGAAGRVLVFLGFPTALAAAAILALTVDRLRGRWVAPLAVVALLLCASVAWPGVVDQADLDAKWSNAFAAVGVAVVLALSLAARAPAPPAHPSAVGDRARVAVATVAVLLSAPWIAADLGFFLDGVPLLGSVFITGELSRTSEGAMAHAVHHGHHHGLDGLLLTLAALLLSRALGSLRGRLRAVAGAYLALMLVYGLTNLVNDGWDEQVFKRGWTDSLVPNVLEPRPTLAWAAMLAVAAVLYALCFSRRPLLGRR